MNKNKSSTKGILENKTDAEIFFRKQISEIDEETFIAPYLSENKLECSIRKSSLFIDREKINSFCMDLNISSNILFLAGYSFALSKFVYNENLLFSNSGTFEGVPFCEYPLILNLNTDLNVTSFLNRIDEMWSNSLVYHDLLLNIVDEYGFNPKFLYQFSSHDDAENNYDLIFNVAENNDNFELSCMFNEDMYSSDLINSFLNCISIILNEITDLSADELENTFLKDISVPDCDDLEFVENEEANEKYFRNQLSKEVDSTVLTPDLNNDGEIGELESLLENIDSQDIKEFCEGKGISPNTLLLSSTILALNKYTFSDKTLLTAMFRGRLNSGNHNPHEFLTKTFPLVSINEDRNISITEFLNQTDALWKNGIRHSNYPYSKLAEEFNLKPEFMYVYNNLESEEIKLDPVEKDYKITFDVNETEDSMELVIFYNNGLYSKEYIKTFLDSVLFTLNQFVNGNIEELKISEIELGKRDEQHVFTPVENPYIHKRFENQVLENPDNVALVAGDATLTYRQLDEKANVVANALIDKGVKPKSNVLVMLSRDSNLIVSILGILKAGCAFIPIDPEYPAERINYIYENSQADYIIANDSGENSLDINELLKGGDCENPDVDLTSDDLAYMIYTSGSTGNPKGVMISHENICNQVQNPKSAYDSLICITTISFDVSIDDILTSLSNGLKLILADDTQIKNIPELVKLIDENKPEVLDITPSRFASYLEVNEFCKVISCLKCIFIGGEQFSAKVFEDLRKYSDAVVYNSYGPTETSITSNNKEVIDVNNLTVGLPLTNYITDVRDIDGKLLPLGVMGELYIGGTGVGKGYYNMPEKTEEVFLTIDDIPYYRSGDYAIELPNGEIDIKGRIDNQIKLRGLRIEIGEIEANIGQYPNIKQAAVVIREINNNDHLCAYYTAEGDIDSDDLKEFLKGKLTRYMVPTVFMQLDDMPQTPNGKTDLKQLPEPQLRLSLTLPETDTEEMVMDIVSSLTETKEFGTTDDLYAIGFTSLTLMKLNAMIYDQMDVNLDIISLLNDPTIKNIANEIENADILDLDSVVELSKDLKYYPLTENQMGIYYECIQSGDVAQYNLPSIIRFDRSIDADRLKEAIVNTINTYPFLKTRIVTHEGKIMLKRDDSIAIDEIPIVEIDNISDVEIEKENLKQFDLHKDQLFRFKIYKTGSENILFSDVHHIISDGESLDKLFTNIANAYQGLEIEKETIDGYINCLIESEHENSEMYELSRMFFQENLTQEVDSTVLTPNLNGNYEEGVLKSVSKNIDPEAVNEFCSEHKITPNVLFMAMTILNLNKYTFNDKTLITTIFNGRSNASYINTQALLVKTLPIVSINEDRTLTIKEFLNSVNDIWRKTINHSDYSYTKISQEFGLKPEFFYAYNNLDAEKIEINGNIYEVKYLNTLEVNYKISLDVNETKDNIELFIQYNDQLYSQDYIETFLNGIVNLINQLFNEDIEKLCINEIELCPGGEAPVFTPLENPILHKRFENQVAQNPDGIALIAGDAKLTYKQLDDKANVVANALIDKGVKPKSNILIKLSRDSNLIASILGVLKAGCAFIPIDPEYPAERIRYIHENSQADYIIANDSGENSLDIEELLEESNCENPNVDVEADDLAYMIYTSGSTGNPKGVMISHINACNETAANPKCEYNNLLSIATIAFDTSLEDILTGLTNGIEIIFANDAQIKNIDELIGLIKQYEPEVMEFTPSRLLSYLEVKEFCDVLKCAKCIVMGGEQFSAKAFELAKKYCNAVIYNSYGPTEATIASNYKEITDANDITIGKALENYVTEVRDMDGKLLPKGVMGELYIGGVGVGKGYYNMPEKTKEVFLTINDIPYYRSGDYAIELPNGEIDIKGRIDNQIKLRGLRIEIGEIESNIGQYPDIKQVVVVIKEINNNDHLCAYYVGDGEIDIDDLKEFLKGRLTRYMVPTVFMQLDEIPQTPNGKTDVKNLPKPVLITEYVEPKNDVQRKLYEICSEILDFTDFGVTDNLFSLGFSSLSLMKLSHEIYSSFNTSLSFKALMDTENICDLEKLLNSESDVEEVSYEKQEYYPLSHNQLNVYIESVKNPDKLIYNMGQVIEFGSDIDPVKLKESLIKVFNHHSYLKSIITQKDGKVWLKRQDDAEVNVNIVNKECTKKIQEKFVKPFNLLDSPLYRAEIFYHDNQTTLLLDVHHIIFDGISSNIFIENLINAYQGDELLEEVYTGFEYILEDYRQEELDSYRESEEYYKSKIAEIDTSTDIIPNITKPIENAKLGEYYNSISKKSIDKYCKEYNITPNNLFLSATLLALSKYTYTKDMLIATISSGRLNPNYENTLAMIVRTLPFIHKIDTSQSVGEYFNSVQNTLTETISHENYPYTKLFEKYNINPNIYYAYQIGIEVEDRIVNDEGKFNSLDIGDLSLDLPKFNLSFYIEEDKDNYQIFLRYNDALYSYDFIVDLANNVELMVNKLQEDFNKKIGEISLLPSEKEAELREIHNTFESIEIDTNLKELFEGTVLELSEKTALVDHDQTLSYNQLNRMSNRIAHSLADLGISKGDHVILKLERSAKLISAIYAVIKTGASFTIVSTEQPEEQTEFIMKDTDAKLIIQSNIEELLDNENEGNVDADIKSDDLACIVYTSGSTGKPKGVKITHKGLINYINPRKDNIAIHAIQNDVSNMLSLTTTTFIAFLREVLATIINGTKVTLASDEESKNLSKLIRLIKESEVDGLSLTPSRIQEYMKVTEFKDLLKQFKVITIGGEKFIPSVYTDISVNSDAKIFNSYGSSENTIATHQKLIVSDEITEGTPIPNNIDLIIDVDGNPLPNNIIGEICTAGVQTSPGYINRDDLNESEFITVNNLRFYKTGDLAYKNSNDELVIRGRKDNQIKLRGQRIEPGEIESAISKYPGIESAVVALKLINKQENLCAYFTSPDEIDVEDLKDYLSTKLIRYMIPTSFTQLDSMPKTPNGKIDIRNLPVPKVHTEFVSAENELEESIFDICAEIAGFNDFGVTDNLYELGFTSLTLMRLSSEVYSKLEKEINVTVILQKPTIRGIAENIEITEQVIDTSEDLTDNESKFYRLTPNQLGVYFDCVKDLEKVNYNMPKYVEFGEGFDENRLKSAIIKVINAHPYLKTRIVMNEGSVYQERRDNLIIDDLIEIVEVDEVDDKFKEEFIKPFDLAEGPLFRFKIIKNRDGLSLLCDFHHIIVDGASFNILFRQIAFAYDNPDWEVDKKELEPLDGFDYSQKEVKIQESSRYKEAELFFFNKIKEHEEGSLITADLNGIEEEGKYADEFRNIDKSVIDDFCKEASITPNNLFLSVSSFVLSKFVNNRNLLFATITNGRFTPDEQDTLAMMVKTLPLSLKVDGDLTFNEYFNYINKEWVDTLSYSSYPLTKIVDKYGIVPEFIFAFNGELFEEIDINGKTVERDSLEYDDLKFKLNLDVTEINDEYQVGCQYNDALYSNELINTFLESVIIVLKKLTKFTSQELDNVFLKDISIIEREMPNVDELAFSEIEESVVHRIFEKQVELHGDEVILTAADGDFTYNELNERANRIANVLIKKGVEIEDKIMFILKRDSNVLTSMIGILKAGACFIPIDSDYPEDRIEHILTDSESKFIIYDDVVDVNNIDLSAYADKLLAIDELLEEENISNPDVDVAPGNLAYLIYTSGSTGLPKGVMIEHGSFANFIYPDPANSYCYELVTNAKKENYKILSIDTVVFDSFLDEMLLPILNNVPVVFADDKQYKDALALIPLIKKTNANIFDGTPSRLLQYLEIDELKDLIANFKIFVVGGEVFPKHLYDILSKVSDGKIFNSYGPTEITVACNDKLIDRPNLVSVGGPMFNVYEEIMDMDSNPLPANVLGELYVAGKGVSRSYYNRPEKNAEAFETINGIRFYRTGDLAKWDKNGEVEIFGRLDDQIKLRGLRIEMGEIESAIKEFEGIKSLAVVVKKIKGNDHLCAYFTVYDEYKTDDETYSIDIEELKEYLGEKLTYYMVPTVYMELDEMPQTLNGKTDLRNLPEPVLISEYVAPENDVEAFFADTFADILSLDKVGVTDNFFEIGGTSLLVTKITIAALNRDFNITYGDVFENPTPRKLADFILTDDHFDVSLSEEFDYDYSEINELLEKNTLENFINGEMEDDFGDILLTGATGFLGIHVLRELLENTGSNIYCFVRSRGNLSSEERLKSLLFYYFSNNYEELFNNRLYVVDGDVTNYNDFEKLISYNINTIFNCAANVKHFSSGTDIEDINLGGVINGLKFAKLKNAKYIQISTYSVAGESINNFPPEDYLFNERDLFIGQSIDNQYISSKFLAERAVLEAAVEDDLTVKIMRVGNLMARSEDKEFQINFKSNGFVNQLKAFVTVGRIPYSTLSDDDELSPIDVTAKSIVELSKTPKECVVFHPYQHHTICFGDIVDIIKPLGLEIEAVEEDEYEYYLNEVLKDKDRQEGVSGLITSIGSGKFRKVWMDSENDYTIQVLYRLGVKWPLISHEYIYKFVEFLRDMAFFD